MKYFGLITIAAMFLLFEGILQGAAKRVSWKSGNVVLSGISGHGPDKTSNNLRAQQHDIWWNYCISVEKRFYSVVSRLGPEKSGLTQDRAVRFFEKNNRIYIISPAGKRIDLRILRKTDTPRCQ